MASCFPSAAVCRAVAVRAIVPCSAPSNTGMTRCIQLVSMVIVGLRRRRWSMANVLITGCSSGFGLLAALRFARAGDRVVATMRTPDKAPAELTEPTAREKLPITLGRLDVCDAASVAAAVREAGPIDVLVNNAGIEL